MSSKIVDVFQLELIQQWLARILFFKEMGTTNVENLQLPAIKRKKLPDSLRGEEDLDGT